MRRIRGYIRGLRLKGVVGLLLLWRGIWGRMGMVVAGPLRSGARIRRMCWLVVGCGEELPTRHSRQEFPDVELKHQLADSLSMIMCTKPTMFNGVIHTDNTFGDMLSDQAGGIVGTLGVLPSASLCGIPGEGRRCNGIYEPVHGSAPDISGRGIVNPMAQILSVALMLRYSFDMEKEATILEAAVEKVLDGKDIGGLEVRTGDLGGKATTRQVGDAVSQVLDKMLKGISVGGSGALTNGVASPLTTQHQAQNDAWEQRLKNENVPTGAREALAL